MPSSHARGDSSFVLKDVDPRKPRLQNEGKTGCTSNLLGSDVGWLWRSTSQDTRTTGGWMGQCDKGKDQEYDMEIAKRCSITHPPGPRNRTGSDARGKIPHQSLPVEIQETNPANPPKKQPMQMERSRDACHPCSCSQSLVSLAEACL